MTKARIEEVHRIAVINFGGIGDELLFSPVLTSLGEQFPQAQITLLLEKRSGAIAPLLPAVHQTEMMTLQNRSKVVAALDLLQRLRAGQYDLVVSSGSNPMIALMLFLSGIRYRVGFDSGPIGRLFLSAAAPLIKPCYAGQMYFTLAQATQGLFDLPMAPDNIPLPRLGAIPRETIDKACSWLPSEAKRPLILVHPGVSRVSIEKNIFKTWSSERWAACIQQLSQRGSVFLVGGPDDAEIISGIEGQLGAPLANFTNLYGQTQNLAELAALIQQADVLVSVDSSPLHLAVALNKPVVVMFGPTDEGKLMPPQGAYPQGRAVTLPDLPCRPCLWDVRQTNCEASTCLEVPVSAMIRAVDELLSLRTQPVEH